MFWHILFCSQLFWLIVRSDCLVFILVQHAVSPSAWIGGTARHQVARRKCVNCY